MHGLAHVVHRDGLMDLDYLHGRTEGWPEVEEMIEEYTPQEVERISGIPAADLERAAHIYAEAENACISLGPGGHRAPLRLRGRAPHLQPRAHDRQHRSPGRRAAAAARAEQRPGLVRHGRASRHVHDVPLGRRRRRRALLRGGVGRPAVARQGLHDPADVRRGGRRRPQGDVHLRRGRRADRSGHAPRRQGARVARVPRLPGHLRDRDDEVRRRDPARVRLPGEGGHVHQRRAADADRRRRRSRRPAARRRTSRSSPRSRRRSATRWATRRRRTSSTRSRR